MRYITGDSMAFMYILLCGDDSYYTGSARDLAHRIDQHMSGEGCV
jgi:putative endonuclease